MKNKIEDWEKEFDEKFRKLINGELTIFNQLKAYKKVKSFIRQLLKNKYDKEYIRITNQENTAPNPNTANTVKN